MHIFAPFPQKQLTCVIKPSKVVLDGPLKLDDLGKSFDRESRSSITRDLGSRYRTRLPTVAPTSPCRTPAS